MKEFRLLQETVCEANLELSRRGIVLYTWGNVSGIDRDRQVVAIKPSGVAYRDLTPDKIVLLSLAGKPFSGSLRPSADTPTHLHLYQACSSIGGIAHTHSLYATMFAQAGLPLPCCGTTHADHFRGPIPVTRALTVDEINGPYEEATGRVIVEAMEHHAPMDVPAVLVAHHGPFTWGLTPEDAVKNSVVLETVAHLTLGSLQLNPGLEPVSTALLERHFQRKHGPDAYYGQR